jgi:hypothetical protein
MGESLSWMAIKGHDRETIYSRLRLVATGAAGDCTRGNIGSRMLAEGWILIVLGQAEHPLLAQSELQKLSAGCEVVDCNVEEHVMFSSSECWKDGQRLWWAEHQGDSDIPGLQAVGEPPAAFTAVEQQYRPKQTLEEKDAEVDCIFEIPLVLARSICGFKHDEPPFVALDLLRRQKQEPRWKFWKWPRNEFLPPSGAA